MHEYKIKNREGEEIIFFCNELKKVFFIPNILFIGDYLHIILLQCVLLNYIRYDITKIEIIISAHSLGGEFKDNISREIINIADSKINQEYKEKLITFVQRNINEVESIFTISQIVDQSTGAVIIPTANLVLYKKINNALIIEHRNNIIDSILEE